MQGLTPEQLDLLLVSSAWSAISAKIAVMVEDHRAELEADHTQDASSKLRGAIAALRRVQLLPEILRSELESAKSAKPTR